MIKEFSITLLLVLLLLPCYGQVVATELNYAKGSSGIMTITYRTFIRCEGSYIIPSFDSYIFPKGNYNLKEKLSPVIESVSSIRRFCNDSFSKCNSTNGTEYDIVEVVHKASINLASTVFLSIKDSCTFQVDYQGGFRDNSITTIDTGSKHYNFCWFNYCTMGVNKSPWYDFSLDDQSCQNTSFYLTTSRYNDIRYDTYQNFDKLYNNQSTVLGYINNNKMAWYYPFSAYNPSKQYPFRSICIANPIIGVCLDQSDLYYTKTRCNEKAVAVLKISEVDSNENIVGEVRREFVVSNTDSISYKGINSAPSVRLEDPHKRYANPGEIISITIKSFDIFGSFDSIILDSVAFSLDTLLSFGQYTLLDSTSLNPTLQYIWKVDSNDINTEPYFLKGAVNDFSCTQSASVSFNFPFYIVPKPNIEFKIQDLGCGQYEIFVEYDSLSQEYYSHSISCWQQKFEGIINEGYDDYIFSSNGTQNSTSLKDTVTFLENGKFNIAIRFTDIAGYGYSVSKDVHISNPQVVLPYQASICMLEQSTIVPSIYNTDSSSLSYQWKVNESNYSNKDSFMYRPDSLLLKDNFLLSIKIEDTSGCKSTSNIAVEVVGKNKINLLSDISLCTIDLLLAPGNFKTYIWNTGDTSSTLKVTKPGKYILNVTDYNENCNGQYDSVTISLLPTPHIPYLRNNGQSIYSNKTGWHNWILDGELINRSFDSSILITKKGLYQCVFISEYGCSSDTSSIQVVILSLDEHINASNITVYPNPVKDYLNIESTKPLALKVFNSLGQLIIESNSKIVYLGNKPKGVYFLLLIDLEGRVYKTSVIRE